MFRDTPGATTDTPYNPNTPGYGATPGMSAPTPSGVPDTPGIAAPTPAAAATPYNPETPHDSYGGPSAGSSGTSAAKGDSKLSVA